MLVEKRTLRPLKPKAILGLMSRESTELAAMRPPLDLCPHPVTMEGWVFTEVGEGNCAVSGARDPLKSGVTSIPTSFCFLACT